WWSGLSLGIASLPLLAVLYLVPGESNLALLVIAAALAASLFWTLQSLVYLKMRRLVDGTAENEIWDDVPDRQPGIPERPVAREVASEKSDAEPKQSAVAKLPASLEVDSELLRPKHT